MRALVIAIHDVAPSTADRARALRGLVAARVDGPVSLLVVPRYAGRESLRSGPGRAWLRRRAGEGDEIVLHGYTHLDRAGREGPELRGRRAGAVDALIRDGLDELAAADLRADGFIAPAYAHPATAGASCRAAGLRWWATRAALHGPSGRRHLPSIGLGASTGTRRALSPVVAAAAAHAVRRLAVVRLDLHPADLGHPRLAATAGGLLDELLAQGRRPVTHAALETAGGG